MTNSLNPLLYSIKLASSYRISSFFLVLLSGFSVIAFSGLYHIDVQGSVDCDRQIFSLVDCPESSSGEEGTNDNDVDDRENIEEQIPTVIPFLSSVRLIETARTSFRNTILYTFFRAQKMMILNRSGYV